MKRVILKSLAMVNFKGEKGRTTCFNPGATTLSGRNGLGKSRHFDAFLWLMFGKDAQDRKDYEVKTRVDGEELHRVECSVSAVLDVDGVEVELKRALTENWVKPKGKTEQVLKGNITECWWNGTPVTVTEYNKRVDGIINAALFKMLTNPTHFANMPWKAQRDMLFEVAGAISDAELAARKPEFKALTAKLENKALEDFKREIHARKERLKADLAQMQPRIDQTHRMKPEAEDFTALEGEIKQTEARIGELDKEMADIAAATRRAYEAERAKQEEINRLDAECRQLVFDAKAKAQDEAFKANSARREMESRKADKARVLGAQQGIIAKAQGDIAAIEADIAAMREKQKSLRAAWYEANEKEWDGETVCPHCRQELPADMVKRAKDIFNATKTETCNGISQRGKIIGNRIGQMEELAKDYRKAIDEANATTERTRKEIARLEQALAVMPTAAAKDIEPSGIAGWSERQQRIAELKASLVTEYATDTTAQGEERKAQSAKRDALKARLGKRDAIAKADAEIARLEALGKELAQQIADTEREEFTIEEFTRAKIAECESRINGMFSHVRFRLFDYTLEGNPVETCIPFVGGVPYGTANTAARINAGLDIINVLCRFYGVTAPIFIDNRESVNEIIGTEAQVVNLLVTDENEINIK